MFYSFRDPPLIRKESATATTTAKATVTARITAYAPEEHFAKPWNHGPSSQRIQASYLICWRAGFLIPSIEELKTARHQDVPGRHWHPHCRNRAGSNAEGSVKFLGNGVTESMKLTATPFVSEIWCRIHEGTLDSISFQRCHPISVGIVSGWIHQRIQ